MSVAQLSFRLPGNVARNSPYTVGFMVWKTDSCATLVSLSTTPRDWQRLISKRSATRLKLTYESFTTRLSAIRNDRSCYFVTRPLSLGRRSRKDNQGYSRQPPRDD